MNQCMEWRGYLKNGYGAKQYGGRGGEVKYLHRVAFEWANGQIPQGMCVLHRCDNPPCVNPDHLFLGTKKDNSRDMWAKGRGISGLAGRYPIACKAGHPWTTQTTYLAPNGGRVCRICRNEWQRIWRAR
jgi:hypothetical protein